MRILSSLLFIASLLFAAASDGVDILLWPDGAPNEIEWPYSDELTQKNNLSPVPYITLFEAPDTTDMVVLACPGGGYGYLAKFHEGTDFAPWLNDQGITLAVLTYRMPCQHSDVPLSDVHQAMRMLREKYPERKVGIMGFSAGGHLASTGATHFVDDATRPDFQVLFYPVISMDTTITHMGTHDNLIGENASAALTQLFSNELQVTPQTPPAIIFHCTDDDVVPVANALRYCQALADANVSAEMHIFPRGGHGWGFGDRYEFKPVWSAALKTWLSKQ